MTRLPLDGELVRVEPGDPPVAVLRFDDPDAAELAFLLSAAREAVARAVDLAGDAGDGVSELRYRFPQLAARGYLPASVRLAAARSSLSRVRDQLDAIERLARTPEGRASLTPPHSEE